MLSNIFHEIAPEVEFDKLDMTRPPRDQIEIDSFDFYRIIVQIGLKTGINIPYSKIAQLANMDQLINFISGQPSPHQPQSTGP